MKRHFQFWHVLGIAFVGSFLAVGDALGQKDLVVNGTKMSDGGHRDVEFWKNDVAARVCELDSLTLLYGQAEQVKRDAKGQPVSCSKDVTKLTHGTRVQETTPSDSCNTRHPPGTFRRISVLDGPHAGETGCVRSSALASEASP